MQKMSVGKRRFSPETAILCGILLVAFLVRLRGITFGLPSLYDPDEPFFIITGLKLLHDGTLNPAWFGHPGTTTVYMLALIELAVLGLGLATGRFASVHAFGEAVYTNPAVVFVPGRLFIVFCGVACVLLTFLLGKRLFDRRVGLTAAAVLALNPLHVTFSQIIRTDVHATVFMLLCALACISIVRRGRMADYLAAGILVGVACATKWPAATICACIVGACAVRCLDHPADRRRQLGYLALAVVAAPLALFVVSPFILLDFHQVVLDLGGEAQPHHLGATGGDFVTNVRWYITHPLRESFGLVGLALAATGVILIGLRNRAALGILVLGALAFLFAVSSQTLIWSRWIVPVLPFVSLFIAAGLWGGIDLLRPGIGRWPARACALLVGCGLLLPMAYAVNAEARERLHDTRAEASAWARAHFPKGSTVLVEYLAIDLAHEGWQFRFPAGDIGCIDALKALKGQIRTSAVGNWRGGRSIIDIGTIDPAKLDACRSDFAIFTHYDRYKAEQAEFGPEVAVYERLMKSGVLLKTFTPEAGKVGGPIVRIVKLDASKPIP